MSTNQRRNCGRLQITVLLHLTTPAPVSSLLSPFRLPVFYQLVLTFHELQCFICLLLLQPFQLLEDLPLKVFWCCLLHVKLHFLPERKAMPLQHHHPFQVLLPSRHTGDEDLVRSLSENLKQLLAILTARLVWRQDLFLQFSRTFKTSLSSRYFNIFFAIHSQAAVQFWSASSSTSCTSLLALSFLRHLQPLTLIPSHLTFSFGEKLIFAQWTGVKNGPFEGDPTFMFSLLSCFPFFVFSLKPCFSFSCISFK